MYFFVEEIAAVPLLTLEDRFQIPLPLGQSGLLVELRQRNTDPGVSLLSDDQIQIDSGLLPDQEVLSVHLRHCGEFQLDVFNPREGGGLEHLASYLIYRQNPQSSTPVEENIEQVIDDSSVGIDTKNRKSEN